MASIVVVALGLALGFRPAGGVPGVLTAVVLALAFCFALGWAWTALALHLKAPDAVLGLTQAVVYPLALFSNIFVDPASLPGWLQTFVNLNPVSHLVTAERSLMAGSPDTSEIGWVLVGCAALLVVFAPLTVRLYRNA
jgi:ABC-2 type transport system permease protein